MMTVDGELILLGWGSPNTYIPATFGINSGEFNPDLVEMNRRDMLFVDPSAVSDLNAAPEIFAHELHHDIWWAAKGSGGWLALNEGMSTFAGICLRADWSNSLAASDYSAFLHYPQGGSFILNSGRFMFGSQLSFTGYLNDRFGPALIREMYSGSPLASGDLLQQTTGLSPERLLVDWAVAQLISGQTTDPRYQITTLPLRGTYRGYTVSALSLLPMDGSDTTGGCRPWGFCYYRAATDGTYTIAVGTNADFHAVLVPGGAKRW